MEKKPNLTLFIIIDVFFSLTTVESVLYGAFFYYTIGQMIKSELIWWCFFAVMLLIPFILKFIFYFTYKFAYKIDFNFPLIVINNKKVVNLLELKNNNYKICKQALASGGRGATHPYIFPFFDFLYIFRLKNKNGFTVKFSTGTFTCIALNKFFQELGLQPTYTREPWL